MENEIVQTAFDYSLVSAEEADKLKECEKVIRHETAGYFTKLGEKFKEAQELLSHDHTGVFEKWYTSLGFKRQTVYRLIQRYDFFISPTVGEIDRDVFEELPLSLSYSISSPDAPKELVERVLTGDITTNAEYQKLLKEKKEIERKLELAVSNVGKINSDYNRLHNDYKSLSKKYSNEVENNNGLKKVIEATNNSLAEVREQNANLAGQRAEMLKKCMTLEKQVTELQTASGDTGEKPEDYTTLEAFNDMSANYNSQLAEKDKVYKEKCREANAREKELLAKIAELEANGGDAEKLFAVYSETVSRALDLLTDFISKNKDYTEQGKNLVLKYITSMEV